MPAGSSAAQPQGVARAVGRLQRERALDREEQAEEDGQPQQAGRRPLQDAAVGVEGEREQHEDEQGEGQHLVRRDAAAGLDAQVLARHQPQGPQHGTTPAGSIAGAAGAAGCGRCGRGHRFARRAARWDRRWPDGRRWARLEDEAPSTATARWASPAARSRSWDATTTVAPAAAAVRSSSSIRSRPSASRPAWGSSSSHSSGRRATSAARAVRRRWPAERRPTAVPARRPARPSRSSAVSISDVAGADGSAPEADVLGDGQVFVEAVVVAEQADAGPDGAAVGGQVDAEDGRLAPAHRQEARAQLQERGLARAVRSLQQHDLAPRRRRGWRPPGPGSGRAPRRRRGGGSPVP